ncbi:uncharacterized protein [Bemisia tabaci]|uniref:uncharacterized protein n=1 Tax=Bemisia tabaci TaxID=7038 RepID=UPI003B285EBA
MKLAVYAACLRRYNESNDRKNQNALFNRNEKAFYRNLTSKEIPVTPPKKEEVTAFWKNLWSNPVQHREGGEWIEKEIARQEAVPEQTNHVITVNELAETIRGTHNWKCPGADNVQNFWYKSFPVLHAHLTQQANRIVQHPELAPEFLTEGRTFIKPKDEDTKNPANYRPITCLPTIYKIITATLCRKIDRHLISNEVLTEEQKGCRKQSKGCKEQLIMDSVILKQTEKNRRNLNTTFIDYHDIKIYFSSPGELKLLLGVVESVSADICMEFGLEKSRVLNIYRGKVAEEEEDQTLYGTIVEQMDENDSYKYLGFQQNRRLNHSDIKHMVQQHYEQRLRVLLRSRLNSRNLFKAINTFAVPVLTYSFGIIKWTTTDLENINIKTRVLLTKSQKLHPKSCKERVTLGREVGGRGLLDIHELCNRQVHDLRTYFTNREHPLHQAIVCTDRNLLGDLFSK